MPEIFDVKDICERMNLGKATVREIEHLGRVMSDFKGTDAYWVIRKSNELTIKNMLSGGRAAELSSDSRLGQLEGILVGFERTIDKLIMDGLRLSQNENDRPANSDDKPVIREKKTETIHLH